MGYAVACFQIIPTLHVLNEPLLMRILFPKSALFFLLAIVATGCHQADKIYQAPSINAFVGSDKCISCHQEEGRLWQGSHHDWAMKLPADSTVLGNFDESAFEADGVSYVFKRNGEDYTVLITDIDGVQREHAIAYTFGAFPLQQYLVEFPDGKYQTLRVTWDSDHDQWFHQYAGDRIDQTDWLHWTRGGQRWNTMCAECHSTNLSKNYRISSDAFNTTYNEINVACEACHGKGSAHVQWALNKGRDPDPYVLSVGKEQFEQLNQCAACHSRRVKLTETSFPEVRFEEQYRIQTVSSEYYFADGQILEEDYVFGSFLQSKMYHNDVKCSDCHDPHSLQLRMTGNDLCMQCHEPKYNSEAHHFHPENTESSLCISCHMTGRYYMGNDFRRDHSFRIPRPDQSLLYGTPNACTGCHNDKTDEWASNAVIEWYGSKRPLNYTDTLLMASTQSRHPDTLRMIYHFIADESRPELVRATALEYLVPTGSEQEVRALLDAARDSSSLVRYHALTKFMDYPPARRIDVGMRHLQDTSMMVRLAAANLTLDQNESGLDLETRGVLARARKEYESMLKANADFPAGRLQYGDFYMRQNQYARAIEHYEKALKMDSLLFQVYTNLATAYNLSGQDSLSMATLNTLLKLRPDYDYGYYLRALLAFELGEVKLARSDLGKATRLFPGEFRYYYNLANILFREGDYREAEKIIRKGLDIQPQSEDGRYLLELIRQRG